MTGIRWTTFWTRLVGGLSLLLMLGVFVGAVGWLWSGDWRWMATGLVSTAAGLAIGYTVTEGVKR